MPLYSKFTPTEQTELKPEHDARRDRPHQPEQIYVALQIDSNIINLLGRQCTTTWALRCGWCGILLDVLHWRQAREFARRRCTSYPNKITLYSNR